MQLLKPHCITNLDSHMGSMLVFGPPSTFTNARHYVVTRLNRTPIIKWCVELLVFNKQTSKTQVLR